MFMVGITVTSAAVLFAFRPSYPSTWISISYLTNSVGYEPAWGDGSDCKNLNGIQSCLDLPVLYITVTAVSPPNLAIKNLVFVYFCNGTVYLEATLAQMAILAGTSENNIGANAPQLQHCGSYTPPKAAFNRLVFFNQIVPGSPYLMAGDTIMLFTHTFTTFTDDDFHGSPPTCWQVPGACSIQIYYAAQPTQLALVLPLYGLSD